MAGLVGSLNGKGKLLEAASHLEQPHPTLQGTAEQLAFLPSQKTTKMGGKTLGKPVGVQTVVYSVLQTLGVCQHRPTGSFSSPQMSCFMNFETFVLPSGGKKKGILILSSS